MIYWTKILGIQIKVLLKQIIPFLFVSVAQFI